MIKKLTKHGNSLALLIDRPILELLNINEETKIKIKTDGSNIIIEPIHNTMALETISENDTLQKLYEKLVEKYDKVFKKLAKN